MKKRTIVAMLFLGVLFCHADEATTPATAYGKFFEKERVSLSIVISADGKEVMFQLQNNTNKNINIAPFCFLDNYLLIKNASGQIAQEIMFRKGKYHLISIEPGESKVIRKVPLPELIRGYAGEKNKGKIELIWFFDMSKKNVIAKKDGPTFFRSNKLIIDVGSKTK